MSARTYTIQDRRRAMNLYTLGRSLVQVRRATGIPKGTLRDWMDAAGILRTRGEGVQYLRTGAIWLTPENVERARKILADGYGWRVVGKALGVNADRARVSLVKLGLRAQRRGLIVRRARIDPAKPKARAYLARIADAARMRADGRTLVDIAAHFGVHLQTAYQWGATPYGRALRAFVHGSAPGNTKSTHARAMFHRQGLPPHFIAKVLDVETATVEGWIVSDERRKAAKLADGRRAYAARKSRRTNDRPEGVAEAGHEAKTPPAGTDDGGEGVV